MSINMQSSLDILKRQALFTIMGNMSITQVYLKEQLNKYITTDGSTFNSLVGRINFDETLISSSQINSICLLAYLDFYAIYTILIANYPIFETLKGVSEQKYKYVDSLYKDLSMMIAEKTFSMSNSNVMYINFMYARNINLSETNSRENNNPSTLNVDILTLPIKSTKTIYPSSIIVSDDDKTIHSTVNSSTLDIIDYSIQRVQNSMIGIVEKVYAGSSITRYSVPPVITGTIYGYFSSRLFVQCSRVIKENDSITEIYLKSSSNGQLWSDEYKVIPATPSSILIEGNIDVGLYITLYDIHPTLNYTLGLTSGDIWNIDIKNISVPNPKIKAKVKFEALDFSSYISFDDVSSYELSNVKQSFKKKRYDDITTIDNSVCYRNSSNNITPVFDQVSELEIEAQQDEYDIKQVGSRLAYSFGFNIENIHLVSNEYEQQGSVTTNQKTVSNISSISIDPKEFIYKNGLQKSFIEYNVIVKNDNDEITIPILPLNYNGTIYEYIAPYNINSNVAYFKTRFPSVITNDTFTVYNLFNGEETDVTWDVDELSFKIADYNPQYSYSISYDMVSTNFSDLMDMEKWTSNSGLINPIFYTYHKDTKGMNYIMLRENNGQSLFSGQIKSFIEMRSAERTYITPIVYELALLSS